MLKVLVVEDDARVAQINRGFVQQVQGFAVVGTAGTAAEAERLLAAERPDLLILDLYLPDGSGLELLRRLRSGDAPADVIVVTAAKEGATVQAALRAGAVDYLLKPYRFERFADALRQYRRYRQEMATAAEVGQEQVDRLFARGAAGAAGPPGGAGEGSPAGPGREGYPKGIDGLTLERVEAGLRAATGPLTAEALGSRVGLSRSTTRRYLEYLVETGGARVQPGYGDVGRPERLYMRTPGTTAG